MTSHPNRGKGKPSRNPKPADILAAREESGLTQTQAGELLHTSCRVWQQWEAGVRRMHPAFFELFNIKRPKGK
jgi:DNA-binding transcriptional regulator YiaG